MATRLNINNQLHQIRKWLENAEKALEDSGQPKMGYLDLETLYSIVEGYGEAQDALKYVGDTCCREIKAMAS